MSILATRVRYGTNPMLSGRGAPINYSGVTTLAGISTTTVSPVSSERRMQNLAYITFHGGLFWALWTESADADERATGSRIMTATSTDGLTWNTPFFVTPTTPPPPFRWRSRGFWIRNGELLVLANYDEANPGVWVYGPTLTAKAFRWSGTAWELAYDDIGVELTVIDMQPIQLPSSEWLFTARNRDDSNETVWRGDIGNWTQSPIVQVPIGEDLNEPQAALLPDGTIGFSFRSDTERLYQSISYDGGFTVEKPWRTNFPDGPSRHYWSRLSNGKYLLASNPGPGRNPLCVSVSDDGAVYNRMFILRNEPTSPVYPHGTKIPGYQYPHWCERDGYVYVIYSRDKEDLQVSRFALSALT